MPVNINGGYRFQRASVGSNRGPDGTCENDFVHCVSPPALQNREIGGCGALPDTPEFTNEVQHFLEEVLRWGGATSSFPWKIDARLPGFLPMAARSGKSRQLWIARHQRFLGS